MKNKDRINYLKIVKAEARKALPKLKGRQATLTRFSIRKLNIIIQNVKDNNLTTSEIKYINMIPVILQNKGINARQFLNQTKK